MGWVCVKTHPHLSSEPTATPGVKQVVLAWSGAVTNGAAITYSVYVEQGGVIGATYTTTSTNFTVPNLTTGSSYYFAVRSTNTFGSSAALYSATVRAL